MDLKVTWIGSDIETPRVGHGPVGGSALTCSEKEIHTVEELFASGVVTFTATMAAATLLHLFALWCPVCPRLNLRPELRHRSFGAMPTANAEVTTPDPASSHEKRSRRDAPLDTFKSAQARWHVAVGMLQDVEKTCSASAGPTEVTFPIG